MLVGVVTGEGPRGVVSHVLRRIVNKRGRVTGEDLLFSIQNKECKDLRSCQ